MKKNNDFSHRKAVILYYPQSIAKIEAVIKNNTLRMLLNISFFIELIVKS